MEALNLCVHSEFSELSNWPFVDPFQEDSES